MVYRSSWSSGARVGVDFGTVVRVVQAKEEAIHGVTRASIKVKGGVVNPITTRHSEYIQGIKIYDIGIKEDPIPGEKRGKGIQHLTSSYWIYDMGVFIQREFRAMQAMAQYAHRHSEHTPGYDFRFFINVSNALFLKAEAEGLQTADARDYFLMANWLAMAAAEVDGFAYAKYSPEERQRHREAFYNKYLSPEVVWIDDADDPVIEAALGKYAIESCRIDLIPTVALERLGIHNELCALKWSDPDVWMKEGFVVNKRFDSMKRHYESVHAQDRSEDHLAHLIWGFMAMAHVIAVFPGKNNLTDFEQMRRKNVKELKDKALESLVGDGGFRAGIPGKTRQSGVNASTVCTVPLPPSKNTYFRLDHHGDEGEKDDGASKVQAPPVQAPVPEAREKEPQEQQQGIE